MEAPRGAVTFFRCPPISRESENKSPHLDPTNLLEPCSTTLSSTLGCITPVVGYQVPFGAVFPIGKLLIGDVSVRKLLGATLK